MPDNLKNRLGLQDVYQDAALLATLLSMPHARATRATAQSIPNATYTTVIFTTEEYDDADEYDDTTGVFTAARGGRLHVDAAVLLDTTATFTPGEAYVIRLDINSGTYVYLFQTTNLSANDQYPHAGGGTTIELGAGDTVEVQVYQRSGGALNTYNDSAHVWVCFDWLR